MNRSLSSLIGLLVALSLSPVFATTFIPDFSTLPVGTAVPIAIFDNATGVTGYYSSSDGPVFRLTNSFFYPIIGNALYDADFPIHWLDIRFSAPITSFRTDFALDAYGVRNLFLAAYLGGTTVGTTSAQGAFPQGSLPPGYVQSYPVGTISFDDPGGFDKISLVSDASDFAIGRELPEPSPFLMLFTGATAITFLRRRLH